MLLERVEPTELLLHVTGRNGSGARSGNSTINDTSGMGGRLSYLSSFLIVLFIFAFVLEDCARMIVCTSWTWNFVKYIHLGVNLHQKCRRWLICGGSGQLIRALRWLALTPGQPSRRSAEVWKLVPDLSGTSSLSLIHASWRLPVWSGNCLIRLSRDFGDRGLDQRSTIFARKIKHPQPVIDQAQKPEDVYIW